MLAKLGSSMALTTCQINCLLSSKGSVLRCSRNTDSWASWFWLLHSSRLVTKKPARQKVPRRARVGLPMDRFLMQVDFNSKKSGAESKCKTRNETFPISNHFLWIDPLFLKCNCTKRFFTVWPNSLALSSVRIFVHLDLNFRGVFGLT